MYPSCATNADCLRGLYLDGNISGPLNWCITAVNCDPHYLTCTTWPRCTSWWYWGCLSSEQKCASWWWFWPFTTDGVTTVTTTHWATGISPSVFLPALILGILILILTGIVIVYLWQFFYCGCGPGSGASRRHRQQEENVQVPMVTLDANSTVILPKHVQQQSLMMQPWTARDISDAYDTMTFHL